MKKISLETDQGKLILSLFVILLTVIGFFIVSFSNKHKEKDWKPLNRDFVIEYGEQKSFKEKDFISFSDKDLVSFETVNIDIPLRHNEELGVSYYEIGSYQGILTVSINKDKVDYPFTVVVKDTKPPSVNKFNEIVVVPYGYSGNYQEFFEFEDYDTFSVYVDTDNINTFQVGQYKSLVRATDASNNKIERDFIVEVRDDYELPTSPIIDVGDKKKSHSDILIDKEIPFTIKRVADPNLYEGEEIIQENGIIGMKEQSVRIHYLDGIEVRREVLSEKIIKSPKEQIVAYGTKVKVEGAYGEQPQGLIRYETYEQDSIDFAKEYYESLDFAVLRVNDLKARGLITDYEEGSGLQNGVRHYYIIFKLIEE